MNASEATKVPVHMSKTISRGFGMTHTTLCGRSRVMADGMNIADKPCEVTCKLCAARLAKQQAS